jgi:hypothetical protein
LTPARRRIPLYDATTPIVCTLSEGEVQERRALLDWLRTNLVRSERAEHGLLLHFPAGEGVDTRLHHFAAVEEQCCRFWGFDIEHDGSTTTLRWDAPPAADELVARLQAYLDGDPDADLSALL